MNKPIKIVSIASGSSGNSLFVEAGNTSILIDAGVSAKKICQGLEKIGKSPSDIKAVFITHEHIDHVNGLEVFSKKSDFTVYMTEKSATEYYRKNKLFCDIKAEKAGFEVSVGDLHIKSFESPHDSVCCVGYTVESADDKFGLATDLGEITKDTVANLVSSRQVLLESNYDIEMLKNGPYERYLKERIGSKFGHLSNIDCAAFSKYLAERGTKNFLLGHLSKENNTPDLAYNYTKAALSGCGEYIKLKVASRSEITFITDEDSI